MCSKSLLTTHFNRLPQSTKRCYIHLGNRTDFLCVAVTLGAFKNFLRNQHCSHSQPSCGLWSDLLIREGFPELLRKYHMCTFVHAVLLECRLPRVRGFGSLLYPLCLEPCLACQSCSTNTCRSCLVCFKITYFPCCLTLSLTNPLVG